MSLVKRAFAGDLAVTQPSYGFSGTFGALVSQLINIALIVGAIAALIFILYGGFMYLTAGDEADKAEGGRRSITNGVIGLVILASAYVLWQFVTKLLGLDAAFV